MFRLIRWIFSTITTIIVIGVIIYFFRFQIRGDALCISLRHREHKQKLYQLEEKVKREMEESKQKIKKKLKHDIIKEVAPPEKNNGDSNGKKQLDEFIKEHM